MKSSARVVIVGGGIVGVSIAYHLTKFGWTDVVLVEMNELTAGSTWHAAGLLPLFNMSYSVGQLHKYSVDLYQSLEAETGQPVSFHKTGNLRLATNKERMDEYHRYCATANTIGVPFEIVDVKRVKELWPPCDTTGVVGALFHPQDGHVAPADVTMALAKAARGRGAEINRQTKVTGIQQKLSGEWVVRTNKGDITAEHVVTASGSWARQIAAMVGLDIPVIAVEHQYIVTEPCDELLKRKEQGLPEMAVLRESDQSYYLREERQGLIVGPYEKGAPAWSVDGVPDSFGQELLPPDIDRLQVHIDAAIRRVPMLGRVGIKDCVNGPIPYTPDGGPLIGPAPGLRNYWLAEGFSFGITAAGGAGKLLAEWMVAGEPSVDPWDVDPRRFGGYANKIYTKIKNEEAYEHIFVLHYPLEERPAARPAKTSPIYDRLTAMGAVWGQKFGWERPNWFAPKGTPQKDVLSFRRGNFFEPAREECRAVRERVGVQDLTGFSKFVVSGPGAEAMLDKLVANKLPRGQLRTQLCHALNKAGGVVSEFTITRLARDRFYIISAAAAEAHDHDVLWRAMPEDGSVTLRDVTLDRGVLVLAGPKARDVLRKLTDADLSSNAFPWLSGKPITVGVAPVLALRVNFLGELGWELHHPLAYQIGIFKALMEAGAEFDIRPVGIRAMDSLRIEKGYRYWRSDLTTEYTILEAGMERFVRLDKGEFVGRQALVEQKQKGLPRNFVTVQVEAKTDNDPWGNEPLYANGTMVGRTTSGAYGYTVGKSLALAYVDPAHAKPGSKLEIELLGARHPAMVIPESPWDPTNDRIRA
ncbi:MAG: FAD-dependent oxidoreductase [Alphaproteobacteria bacterium]|nr:FAD-dependent oxidoreductase [Alphaproteobacteria bacterium]